MRELVLASQESHDKELLEETGIFVYICDPAILMKQLIYREDLVEESKNLSCR